MRSVDLPLSDFQSGTYIEWRPPAQLARYVACTFRSSAGASSEPVLPDGCMDIVWDGDRLLVTGPDTHPHGSLPIAHSETGSSARITASVVGLRFRPGVGSVVLGVPADHVRDQRLALEELWPDTERLAETLSACSDPQQCSEVLIAAVARMAPEPERLDALVEMATRAWAANDRTLSPARLADLAGITPRQVQRRFRAAVGYGPKFLERVLRFQAFLGSCQDRHSGLAELAIRSGYADQAHLNRDARLLAGMTPLQLRAARLF